MDKQIIIDGCNVKDCKRRIGKDNFCRYYKRPCAENNYNCIWKKYLRKAQECEELKTTLAEIKEIAEKIDDSDGCAYGDYDCDNCSSLEQETVCTYKVKKLILQKISEVQDV